MSTPLLIILACGATLACWAALTLMGGERARRLHQLQAQRPPAPAPPPTPVISVSATPAAVAHAPAPVPGKSKAAKPQAPKNTR